MPEFLTTDGQIQLLVPLHVKPFSHKAMATVTGNAFSIDAGAVLYGFYNMEYLLPEEDKLCLIANHDKKSAQLLLFTHNPELLKRLPGARYSSLVADTISQIRRYQLKASSYSYPLNPAQEAKLGFANHCIDSLTLLLKKERRIQNDDFVAQEQLRKDVLAVLDHCGNNNRLLADNPIVSEGSLGNILFDAYKAAQHFHFNTRHAVSRQDQMDFTKVKTRTEQRPYFVWDSELHIGHNSKELDDALRVICKHYQLSSAPSLNNQPANRFAKVALFFDTLWRNGHDWVHYLALKQQPHHKSEVAYFSDRITVTQITPYYHFKGLAQKGYASLDMLIQSMTGKTLACVHTDSFEQASKILERLPNDSWVVVASKQQVLLRQANKLVVVNYFIQKGLIYPLPSGEDLYNLSQISKRHLYLPERVKLRFKGFVSQIPRFFKNFYQSLRHFIVHDLHEEFFHHIHASHADEPLNPYKANAAAREKIRHSLEEILEKNGFLANGQTLETFIKEQINSSPYVIARAEHPPTPPHYENPLHRTVGVLRHLAGLFIDTGERNPILGFIALAAYAYGAGAVINPALLTKILTKLHLHGLIAGIEPTQKLAHLMSHGTQSEALSAAVTYWQATNIAGNLDGFFIKAVAILKEDPAEVAIVAALALTLGYSLTKIIPSLEAEMGDFPYTNYAALGAKGGAAVYDTIMHPGEDWLLGTCKWLCKNIINACKIVIAPFFEAYYYGYEGGFINGWHKSAKLSRKLAKQCIAAVLDLVLAIMTVPLFELSALLLHIPFRGSTGLIRKTLATLGNITALGTLLIHFAHRPSFSNFFSDFSFSPLYGFSSPFKNYSSNVVINCMVNILRLLLIPPLQLIKNTVILPLIDIGSLTMRFLLAILNPSSRFFAYTLGTMLYYTGSVWDNSLGLVFSSSATLVTLSANALDSTAGLIKNNIVLLIEVARAKLYYWAFHEEHDLLRQGLDEHAYYYNDPRRFDTLIPQTTRHGLYKLLDGEYKTTVDKEFLPVAQHRSPLSTAFKISTTGSLPTNHYSL